MFPKSSSREALGRGLGSFFPLGNKGADDQKSLVFFCKLFKLVPNAKQPRKAFDDDALDELAKSIHEKGVLQPIVVRPHPEDIEKYEIIAGERRFRASQKAGLDEIPVIVKNTDEQEVFELALIENLQRENLNPIEEATAFYELIEKYQYTHEELAQRLGKSRSLVANALRLLKLPSAVTELLIDGALSNGHARALITLETAQQQVAIAHQIVDEGLSVRETEALIQRLKALESVAESPTSPTTPIERISAPQKWLEDQFRQFLGTRVKLQQKGDRGKLIIEFFSKEDLDRLYTLILKPAVQLEGFVDEVGAIN